MKFSKDRELVIITKDADFSQKLLRRGIPPKVIHIRLGNLKLAEFYSVLKQVWRQIEIQVPSASMINVYIDRLEIVR